MIEIIHDYLKAFQIDTLVINNQHTCTAHTRTYVVLISPLTRPRLSVCQLFKLNFVSFRLETAKSSYHAIWTYQFSNRECHKTNREWTKQTLKTRGGWAQQRETGNKRERVGETVLCGVTWSALEGRECRVNCSVYVWNDIIFIAGLWFLFFFLSLGQNQKRVECQQELQEYSY